MDRVGFHGFKTVVSGSNYSVCHSVNIASIYSYILTVMTFSHAQALHNFKFAQLVNGTCKLAALFCCPRTPKPQIKYISTMKRVFDLGSEAECQ